MNRTPRYGKGNFSAVAGVVLMAFLAVALGYLLGSWAINFVTDAELEHVSQPEVNEIRISDPGQEDLTDTPDNRVTPDTRITPLTSGSNGLYIIQVGAFNKRANAERLRDELLDKGYVSVNITEGPPFKVQLGASETRDEADRLKEEVKEEGYVDVFIVH